MPRLKKMVIFLVGPTAVGKTSLSVRLAKRTGGEVISADSMQVYKGMGILSQAPSAKERCAARHHLIGFLPCQKEFSAAHFVKKAASAIGSAIRRGRIPIVAGGTGLYVKALIDGLFPSPEADIGFRKKMQAFAAKYGRARLHKKLAKIDPDAAGAIHPNDTRRIIRALEIYHLTGRTMTECKSQTTGIASAYNIKIFGLTGPRDKVYSNIDSRVDRMFEAGILQEVGRLAKKRLSKTAKAALGFKEVMGYLKGEYDLKAAKELLKRNTRRFAKRQLAWFRPDRRIVWFDVSRMSEREIVGRIIKAVSD